MSAALRVLTFAVLASVLRAQTPASPPEEDGTAVSLTLQQAEDLALAHHPDLAAAQARVLRSEQQIRERQSAYYPAIDADVTGSAANRDARIGAGFLTDSRLFDRLGAGITVSQLLTDSGRTGSLVREAKLGTEAAEQDRLASREDVLFNVQQAYFHVQLAQALVQLTTQTVKARQAVVDQVSQLAKNKLKSDLDLNFAQVNLSEAKMMDLRAKSEVAAAFALLSEALGGSDAGQYRLQPVELPPAPPAADAAAGVAAAFAHRPELASLRLQTGAAEAFERAERDLKRPTVSLTGVAGYLPYLVPGNANPNIPAEYGGAEINVRIPVFNGHLYSARARSAAEQVVEAQQHVRGQQDRIAADVRAAWSRALSAYAAIAVAEEQLRQATSALSLAEGRYRLGLSAIVELTQAQLAQTQAQVQLLNARYGYQSAHSALQYAEGLLH